MIATNPLSAAQAQYLTPTLKADGWTKRGRHYRWRAPNGDWAAISFHTGAGTDGDHVEFVIEVGLVPKRKWMMSPDYPDEPGWTDGLFRGRVTPTGPSAIDHHWWQVDPESVSTCGESLALLVGRGLAPDMVQILGDPDRMLAAVRDRSLLPPGVGWTGVGMEEFADVVLLVGRGPSQRLAEAIPTLQETWPPHNLAKLHRMLAVADPALYGHLAQ